MSLKKTRNQNTAYKSYFKGTLCLGEQVVFYNLCFNSYFVDQEICNYHFPSLIMLFLLLKTTLNESPVFLMI